MQIQIFINASKKWSLNKGLLHPLIVTIIVCSLLQIFCIFLYIICKHINIRSLIIISTNLNIICKNRGIQYVRMNSWILYSMVRQANIVSKPFRGNIYYQKLKFERGRYLHGFSSMMKYCAYYHRTKKQYKK